MPIFTTTATAAEFDPDPDWCLIGQSPAMRDVIAQVAEAAASSTGVLISGEPGTGRGLVARAIHRRHRPASAPFLAVYCDNVDPATIEIELFGAGSACPGSFHECIAPDSLLYQARGGTTYFRHIEELPDRVQARLAHIFRDRESAVIGNHGPEPFDVRPIMVADAHFNVDLDEGRIRPDLYKRFARTSIVIPPLRGRREDIPALAGCFLSRACTRAGIPAKTLAQPAATVLSALPWTGNVRELKGFIDRLVPEIAGDEIGIEALMGSLRLDGRAIGAGSIQPPGSGTLREARERWEREYISSVLALHGGHVADAARVLGMQRPNLYRKLRALHLLKPSGQNRRRARA